MQSFNLNLVPGSFQQVFNCSQGDIGRQLTAKLFDGSTEYAIPAGSTVKIKATKPSGFGFDESATFSGSTVTITTAETMTNEWGRFPAELVITKDGNVIGTANFLFNIEKNPHPDSTVDGDAGEVIPELTLLVERVEAAASSVLDMEVVATTLPAGSQASYSYDEDLNKATFGIPQGEAGAGAAGVVASAYSSSKTYKVGDYVLHNSNLYRCITAITTAEAFTAAHWTQIVLADDVSDLKSDLSALYYETPIIEQGYWGATDGKKANSATWCRTKGYVPKGYIFDSSIFQFYVGAYEADDTFVGSWNGSTFAKVYTANAYTRHFDVNEWIEKFPSYKFAITFYKAGASITPSAVYDGITITNALNGLTIENDRNILNASISKTNNLVPQSKDEWKQGTTSEAGALRAINCEFEASDLASKTLYLYGKVDSNVLAYGYDFYAEVYNNNTLLTYDHIAVDSLGKNKSITLPSTTNKVKLVLTTGNNSKPITPNYISTHPMLYFGESEIVNDYDFKYKYDDVRYKEIQALNKKFMSNTITSLNNGSALKIKEARKVFNSAVAPLTLLHFSDVHGASGALSRVVDYYNENSDIIDDVICTGDMVYNNYASGVMDFWDAVSGAENILTVLGNHELSDGNVYDADMIGQSLAYTTYFAPYIANWGVAYSNGLTYWSKDYSDSNVKLIGLNYLLTGTDMSAQVSWLADELAEAKANGYAVLIAIHCPLANSVKFESNFTPVSIDLPTTGLGNFTDIMDEVESFITDGGEFVGYIGGHIHCDFVVKHSSYSDQLFYLITTAVPNGTGNDQLREYGNKTQDAVNAFIVDTVTKTVKIVRIGADADCYQRGRNILTVKYSDQSIIAME